MAVLLSLTKQPVNLTLPCLAVITGTSSASLEIITDSASYKKTKKKKTK